MLRWIFLPLLAIAAHAQVYQGKTLVTASLVSDTTGIVPGKPFEVGVLLEMAPRLAHLLGISRRRRASDRDDLDASRRICCGTDSMALARSSDRTRRNRNVRLQGQGSPADRHRSSRGDCRKDDDTARQGRLARLRGDLHSWFGETWNSLFQ